MEKLWGCDVLWEGTAEVNAPEKGAFSANESRRVPVALVLTPKGTKEKIIYKWDGQWRALSACTFLREVEDADGNLLVDIDPVLAMRVSKALKQK